MSPPESNQLCTVTALIIWGNIVCYTQENAHLFEENTFIFNIHLRWVLHKHHSIKTNCWVIVCGLIRYFWPPISMWKSVPELIFSLFGNSHGTLDRHIYCPWYHDKKFTVYTDCSLIILSVRKLLATCCGNSLKFTHWSTSVQSAAQNTNALVDLSQVNTQQAHIVLLLVVFHSTYTSINLGTRAHLSEQY